MESTPRRSCAATFIQNKRSRYNILASLNIRNPSNQCLIPCRRCSYYAPRERFARASPLASRRFTIAASHPSPFSTLSSLLHLHFYIYRKGASRHVCSVPRTPSVNRCLLSFLTKIPAREFSSCTWFVDGTARK